MVRIRLEDVTKIYPFEKVTGLFDRKRRKQILEQQKQMPYTSNEGVVALQHFNMTVNEGEFVVVLGPSGSGKSTLLRIIAGLERPTLGNVYFDDEEYNDVKPEERDVAMVFQNYSLYPNQSVYENVAFPLQVKHMPREQLDEEVKKICGMLGLSEKLDKLPQDLSGGEKQRVAIARSRVKKPAVLLLDEPFSNLDVLMRRSLRNQLKKLHEAYHTTFIYVTHDQYDALSLAERIIILKDGIKQMDDTTVNVYRHPVNRFCAEFIASPFMNVFEDVPVDRDRFALLGTSYSLDNRQKKNLGKEKTITVDIRGSNMHISDEGIEAIVKYTEVVEADLIVHASVDDRELVIVEKYKPDQPIPYMNGQTIHVSLDEDCFHLFDREGRRI